MRRMYNDIVVPSDGSEGFDEVLEHAMQIAEKFDGTIHAVHVADIRAYNRGIDIAPILEEFEQLGQEITQEVTDKAEERGIPTFREVRKGVPHQEILDYADEVEADLIVMGTHGRTGLSRWMLGSVAEKVVRKSDIPVLLSELEGEE